MSPNTVTHVSGLLRVHKAVPQTYHSIQYLLHGNELLATHRDACIVLIFLIYKVNH